jgi:hypothetical protein
MQSENNAQGSVSMSASAKRKNGHRASCHRCGNLRSKPLQCSMCPYVFCHACVKKMKEAHGADVFAGGCPVVSKVNSDFLKATVSFVGWLFICSAKNSVVVQSNRATAHSCITAIRNAQFPSNRLPWVLRLICTQVVRTSTTTMIQLRRVIIVQQRVTTHHRQLPEPKRACTMMS